MPVGVMLGKDEAGIVIVCCVVDCNVAGGHAFEAAMVTGYEEASPVCQADS